MNKDYVVAQALSGLGELNAMLKKMMSQMGIDDPKEVIRRINSDEWIVTVSKIVSYIVATFTVTVGETVSVEDAVKAGKFDWSNDNITSKNFSKLTDGQKSDKEVFLFHFNKTMSSEEVIAKMDKAGYRPGNIWDLIGLAVKEPDLQRKFPIIALGSVCELGGDRHVPCLCEDSS
jgi:hypothetical protein